MKTYYFLILGSALLFSMFGCQSDKNADVQTNTNSTASAESLDGTQNQVQANTSENTKGSTDPTPPKSVENQSASIYTDLAAEKCKTIESDETGAGWYRGECKGVGGFKLEVIEGDIRQSINVIFPNGKKSELEFWSKVSGAFSSVGDKAEWRVTGKDKNVNPYALIVRFNASENPETPDKTTSYLVVTKITKDTACITDIVKPSKDQNLTAQKLADEAANKSCL